MDESALPNDPCLVFSLSALLQRLHDFQKDTKTTDMIPELTNHNSGSCVQISFQHKQTTRLQSGLIVLPTGAEKTSWLWTFRSRSTYHCGGIDLQKKKKVYCLTFDIEQPWTVQVAAVIIGKLWEVGHAHIQNCFLLAIWWLVFGTVLEKKKKEEHVICTEETMCRWRDLKIQELTNS